MVGVPDGHQILGPYCWHKLEYFHIKKFNFSQPQLILRIFEVWKMEVQLPWQPQVCRRVMETSSTRQTIPQTFLFRVWVVSPPRNHGFLDRNERSKIFSLGSVFSRFFLVPQFFGHNLWPPTPIITKLEHYTNQVSRQVSHPNFLILFNRSLHYTPSNMTFRCLVKNYQNFPCFCRSVGGSCRFLVPAKLFLEHLSFESELCPPTES